MQDIPEHRVGVSTRSGDTHVIGADGKAVNVDRRDTAKAGKVPASARDPLDHDGDGRKGGMAGVEPKKAAAPTV